MTNMFRVPTLEEVDGWIARGNAEKLALARENRRRERAHQKWLASPAGKAFTEAKAKADAEYRAMRERAEEQERKAEAKRQAEKAERIARANAAEVARAAYLASPEYKAQEAAEQVKQLLTRVTRWCEKHADEREAALREERARRSRIKWAELIDDEQIVHMQVYWERRQTALAMSRAGLKNIEIGKRMGVTASRSQQLIKQAATDAGRLSPAEKYLAADRVATVHMQPLPPRKAHRLRVSLDACAFQDSRDWLMVNHHA